MHFTIQRCILGQCVCISNGGFGTVVLSTGNGLDFLPACFVSCKHIVRGVSHALTIARCSPFTICYICYYMFKGTLQCSMHA